MPQSLCDPRHPIYVGMPASVAQQVRAKLGPYCANLESMVWMLPDSSSIIPGRSDCADGTKPCFDGFVNSWRH